MAAPASYLLPVPANDRLSVRLMLCRPRVLLVDDDPDLEPVFRRVLHQIDPDVRMDWAASLEDAMERFTDGDYDLVVSDFMLGDGTGLAVKRWVEGLAPDASFGMISAFPIHWDRDATEMKRVPFLAKPFSTGDLALFLRELLPLP